MPIHEITADNLEGLVGQVLTLARGRPPEKFLWFRGHSCADYRLIPSLVRDGKSTVQVFDREIRLLTRFRQRSLAYWPDGYPQNDWEHLFAMQHHGIPTRLLDWSENLLVAAYFASQVGAPPHDHGATGCVPTIWCVDPVDWNRASPVLSEFGESIQVMTTADDEIQSYGPASSKKRMKTPLAIYGTHNSKRIVAQRGTFFVWGEDTKTLEEIAAVGTADTGATLWKFSMTGDRNQFATDIQRLGFSETQIFPELSFLARELTRMEGWR